MRLGIVIYMIPFFFVLEPALILQASIWKTIMPVLTCIIGIVLIAGSLEGYLMGYGEVEYLFTIANWRVRVFIGSTWINE